MMKVSKYTVLFSDNDCSETSCLVFYAYNILSNAFIEIDEGLFKLLELKQKSNICLENSDLSDIDEAVLDVLIGKRFIVENDTDDFLFYKNCILKQRSETSIMHLTIAPTMDCCFNCFYCFEEYKTRKYMDERTMNAILSYLKSLVSKPDFRLTWFGGEPLMAIEQMRILYSKLSAYYKPPIDSNVITTGYHLDENAIQALKEMNVREVQITLDGSKERHNKIKSLDGKTVDVFERVLDNAERLLKESNIKVSFRINLTKENIYEFMPLYKYLFDRFKFSCRKSISPAFVMDRSHNKRGKDIFLTHSEISDFVLELQSKYHIYTPFTAYPSNLFNECAIRNVMSVSFDPEGYAYKCWEYIGNKRYSFGVLNEVGKIVNMNEELLDKQLHDADPLDDPLCSKCKYLPLCSGGCPIQRLENKYENASNNCCTLYKSKLEECLKLYIKLKAEK